MYILPVTYIDCSHMYIWIVECKPCAMWDRQVQFAWKTFSFYSSNLKLLIWNSGAVRGKRRTEHAAFLHVMYASPLHKSQHKSTHRTLMHLLKSQDLYYTNPRLTNFWEEGNHRIVMNGHFSIYLPINNWEKLIRKEGVGI